jgi:hypothetical protein
MAGNHNPVSENASAKTQRVSTCGAPKRQALFSQAGGRRRAALFAPRGIGFIAIGDMSLSRSSTGERHRRNRQRHINEEKKTINRKSVAASATAKAARHQAGENIWRRRKSAQRNHR